MPRSHTHNFQSSTDQSEAAHHTGPGNYTEIIHSLEVPSLTIIQTMSSENMVLMLVFCSFSNFSLVCGSKWQTKRSTSQPSSAP